MRIRFLDNDPAEPSGLPVVFSPGLTDFADDYGPLLEVFGSRRVVVVEVRGRGGSEAPPTGYAVADHLADLRAVIDEAEFDRFHLMTFSRGSSWGLELALGAPDRVASLSIGEYQAVEVDLPDTFAESQLSLRFRGVPIAERVQSHVLVELQRDARAGTLWDRLTELPMPMLVARGSEGGLVDDAAIDRYRAAVPGIEVVVVPGAGHDLFRPDRRAFPRAVEDFIRRRCPGC